MSDAPLGYTVHFSYRRQYLGEGRIESEFRRGELVLPSGLLWVCPICGSVWAKAVIEDRPFEIWAKKCGCANTPYYFEFAGSMILEWDHRLWAAMPREMLLREVIHHCNWWEKFNGTN